MSLRDGPSVMSRYLTKVSILGHLISRHAMGCCCESRIMPSGDAAKWGRVSWRHEDGSMTDTPAIEEKRLRAASSCSVPKRMALEDTEVNSTYSAKSSSSSTTTGLSMRSAASCMMYDLAVSPKVSSLRRPDFMRSPQRDPVMLPSRARNHESVRWLSVALIIGGSSLRMRADWKAGPHRGGWATEPHWADWETEPHWDSLGLFEGQLVGLLPARCLSRRLRLRCP